MGISKIRIIIFVLLFNLTFVVWPVRAEEGNAVGSSARSADNNVPLEGVKVTVAQKPEIQDSTRNEDGVYTIKVSTAIKNFDLLYQKVGYLDGHDTDIQNDKDQQKRPIAYMTPEPKNLPLMFIGREKLIKEATENANAAIKRGEELKDQGLTDAGQLLIESGKKNLSLLQLPFKPK